MTEFKNTYLSVTVLSIENAGKEGETFSWLNVHGIPSFETLLDAVIIFV